MAKQVGWHLLAAQSALGLDVGREALAEGVGLVAVSPGMVSYGDRTGKNATRAAC